MYICDMCQEQLWPNMQPEPFQPIKANQATTNQIKANVIFSQDKVGTLSSLQYSLLGPCPGHDQLAAVDRWSVLVSGDNSAMPCNYGSLKKIRKDEKNNDWKFPYLPNPPQVWKGLVWVLEKVNILREAINKKRKKKDGNFHKGEGGVRPFPSYFFLFLYMS